ncbi:hypothetical protein [Alkalihalobacillus trypoxylicola]|uniref:Uncharacterized protein n=1 Tax=Alkalihalobacillus trypoxylicola TaxID=519424 RepID=A0A161PKV6_9BACI|nr:hypothetical protein [Alkalihalobacillus trypoxylicola]KYG34926.1 hypothetical protein AZF04_00925 [Alkalihalobacillus trypoxylicola]
MNQGATLERVSAEEQAKAFNVKYSKYRIRKTFMSCDDIPGEYKLFCELSKIERETKRIKNEDRITMCNIIIDVIEQRINNNVLNYRTWEIMQLQELVGEIKNDVIRLTNKMHGGDKTAQTKKIRQLERRLSKLELPIDKYHCINYHPFSENRQYESLTKNKWVKTHAFKTWCDYFPYFQMPKEEELNVDWSKPVKMHLAYDHIAKFDTANFTKSAIDMITRYYDHDDNIVQKLDIRTNKHVMSFKDGKIYFYFTN